MIFALILFTNRSTVPLVNRGQRNLALIYVQTGRNFIFPLFILSLHEDLIFRKRYCF